MCFRVFGQRLFLTVVPVEHWAKHWWRWTLMTFFVGALPGIAHYVADVVGNLLGNLKVVESFWHLPEGWLYMFYISAAMFYELLDDSSSMDWLRVIYFILSLVGMICSITGFALLTVIFYEHRSCNGLLMFQWSFTGCYMLLAIAYVTQKLLQVKTILIPGDV